MAKPFADKARANAAAIQAQVEYATAQMQAQGRLAAAKAKISGDLQQSAFDARVEAAQAQQERAQAAQQQGPPEDVVGPQFQPAQMPQPGQPSQSIAGSVLQIDPSQVSGGGGIQAATGGMGRAQPAQPQYNVPASTTTTEQTTGTQYHPASGGLGFAATPIDVTRTVTRPNVLTPYQALNLVQTGELAKQRLAIQQQVADQMSALNKVRAAAAIAGIQLKGANIENINRQAENALRQQYQTESKDFRSYADSYSTFNSVIQQPRSGLRDLALIYNFIKSQDPNAVREGELALAQSAVGAFPRLANYFDRIKAGDTLLPPEVVTDMTNTINAGFRGHLAIQDQRDKQFGQFAQGQGLNPSQIVTNIVTPELRDLAVKPPPSANMLPSGVPPGSVPIGQNDKGDVIYTTPEGKRILWSK